MYIENIKIWNFRKFGTDSEFNIEKPNLDLNLTKGLNVIIGENDSGKTAIIDAIKLILKTHSYEFLRVENDDFYENTNRFRIELKFCDLSDDEAKNFTEWLTWEEREENITPILIVNYDVKRVDGKIFPSEIKAGADEEGYSLTVEAKEYLKTTYLKPLRNAENELIAKRNSRLSQILLGDSIFNEEHQFIDLFAGVNTKIESYFIEDEKGKIIKNKIDSYIRGFYGKEKESIFEASSNNIKSILEKLSLSLKNEKNVGLGTLNRLFMAAELLHLNKENWSGLRLGLIEEIEAHLHPQAQMQIIETLQKQEKIQLILTTHSPNLASKIQLENLIICNNGNAFPMGEDYTELSRENYTFLEKFLDVTKSNLFFAKGVIFVEGWAEEILIPSIAKAMGINLTEKGISIINIGNVGFNHYSKIFLRKSEPYMQIPIAVVTDCDVREYEMNEGEYVKRENIQEEIRNKIKQIDSKSDRNIKYFVAPRWTLEYSLFLSDSMKNYFIEVTKEIHPQIDSQSSFEVGLAKNLLTKYLKKTEIAYKLANKIDSINQPLEISEGDTLNYLQQAIRYVT
ncbi:AAA family ATPase [Riemerella anatipestifer]|nr:AAA family ATPase [Riemerella anatipestifer]